MEALQMVKFFLKKEQLDFTKGWIMSTAQMVIDIDDNDILAMIVNKNIACNSLRLLRLTISMGPLFSLFVLLNVCSP